MLNINKAHFQTEGQYLLVSWDVNSPHSICYYHHRRLSYVIEHEKLLRKSSICCSQRPSDTYATGAEETLHASSHSGFLGEGEAKLDCVVSG